MFSVRNSSMPGSAAFAGNQCSVLPQERPRVHHQFVRVARQYAFFLDHSELPDMLQRATADGKPWLLGNLSDGWEWFAFTFRDQQCIQLTEKELHLMLAASDTVTKQAYSRMQAEHAWAKNSRTEAEFVEEVCRLKAGDSVLDLGCGSGRHAIELASLGLWVLGVDYLDSAVAAARAKTKNLRQGGASFEVKDAREFQSDQHFDAAICLYDVIGSYTENSENRRLLASLARSVKFGGYVLLSVMNMHLTEHRAKHWFSIATEPDKLLTLKAGRKMEQSGEVFDPDYYMIEEDTRVVYRKEQFLGGESLPEELLVRDKRYTEDEIRGMCQDVGLNVVWSRFVRSGHWKEPLSPNDDHAKEILVLCRNPQSATGTLFPEPAT
jgi:2-polyprenyl-3-methyl-5-hydroxy-6-metoxy-1,4-benzoquinol methylase